MVVGICIGLLAFFYTLLNHQERLASSLATRAYTIYLAGGCASSPVSRSQQ